MSNTQETSGREPSLSQSNTQTTGLEPGLSAGHALENLNAIRLSGGAARLGNKAALRTLLNTLRYGADAQRAMAAQALGAIDNDRVGKALLLALQDEVPAVRAASAQSLGRIGRAEYLPSLVPLLEDDTSAVRMMVARAMTNIFLKNEDDKQLSLHVVRHLNRLLRDDIPEVRETACAMLGWIATDEARNCLRLAMHDPLTARAARQGLMWAGRGDEEQSTSDDGQPFRTIHRNRLAAAMVVARTLIPFPDRWKRQLLTAALVMVLIFLLALVIRSLPVTDIIAALGAISMILLVIASVVIDFAVQQWIPAYRMDERIVTLKQTPASRTVLKWGYVIAVLYRARIVMACVLGVIPLFTITTKHVWQAVFTGLTIGASFPAMMIYIAIMAVNAIVAQKPSKRAAIIYFPFSLDDIPKLLIFMAWGLMLLLSMMGQFLLMVPVAAILIGFAALELYKTRDEA